VNFKRLVTELVETRGAIVRNQHHIQIPCLPKGKFHDVWIGKAGLKWMLHGNQISQTGSPAELLRMLDAYHPEQTDLAWMSSLTAMLTKHAGRVGVFVDAGWKDGVAKACFVRFHPDGDTEILIRTFDSPSSHDAEVTAIKIAVERCPGEAIHSDCQSAVEVVGHPAVWIPREKNKVADRLGNRRGGKG